MSYVCDRVFANKCLNCQPCVQFIFSPRCESDMILSVMTQGLRKMIDDDCKVIMEVEE